MITSIRNLAVVACWLGFGAMVSAQEEINWRIEPGDHPMVSMRSMPFQGEGRSLVTSPSETTLIVRENRPGGNEHWDCFETPALKQFSSFDRPKYWDWEMSSVGSRYACSLVDQELVTVDLTTGQLLPTAIVRSFHKPNILFDKAVWFASGELLTLPQLKVVSNHPLVTNLIPFEESENLTSKHVWHIDAKRVVVNGFMFNENLRPISSYLGSFSSRELQRTGNGGGHYVAVPARDGKSNELALWSNSVKTAIAAPDRDPTGITADFPCHGFRGGMVGISPKLIHIINFEADKSFAISSGDFQAQPMMYPPLVSFDGKRQPINWLAKPAEEPIKITFDLRYDFSNNQQTIWFDKADRYFSDRVRQKTIVEQITKRSGVPAGSPFEETIKGYKSNNKWWMDSYAAATKTQFIGIPIETAQLAIYKNHGKETRVPISLILDIPTETLKQVWLAQQPAKPDPSQLSQEGLNMLRALAMKEPAPEVASVEIPPPPRPELDALPVRLATLYTEDFSWVSRSHIAALKLAPASLLIYFFCLTMCTRIAEVFNRPMRLVSPFLLSAGLASIAVVSFNLLSVWLVDILTAGELSALPMFFLLRAVILLVSQFAANVWIFELALAGPRLDKIVISSVAFITNLVIIFVFLVLLFVGGGA